MSTPDNKLESIFGAESSGTTAEERARSSKRIFVRSQDELSICREGAQGRQLSAWEALQTFRLDVLEKAFFDGTAILVESKEEPARTFKARREALGLTDEDISNALGLPVDQINTIENPKKRNPIRDLELVAQYLGLDERKIAFQGGLKGDNPLALRLKTLREERNLNSKTVISFSEAAWLIAIEDRLREWLKIKRNEAVSKFLPNDDLGDASYRAWQIGYDLAEKTRDKLGIAQDAPISSLRELCIDKLALPVIQSELPDSIAGATVANNELRGIVVNISGRNENVWIRRATIAHELGHLLWDPDQNLERIRVDQYDEIDKAWSSDIGIDYVEQRANAFAAEFLAPQRVAAKIYKKEGSLRAVMENFGVSFTLARYQVWNGLYRTEDLDSFVAENTDPTDEWKGRESFTTDYFPIESVPISRRGFFAGVVVLAEQENLISKDTAMQYLRCSEDEYNASKDSIPGLFDLT
ncbi:MAG: XRE family transcriptional regulator [Thermodesulfobacteriota bacterium]